MTRKHTLECTSTALQFIIVKSSPIDDQGGLFTNDLAGKAVPQSSTETNRR